MIPSSYSRRVMSKLRSGPATVFCSQQVWSPGGHVGVQICWGMQTSPAGHCAFVTHGVFDETVPGVGFTQTDGIGNGWKSGPIAYCEATGNGASSGLSAWPFDNMKPGKLVSSPSILPDPANDPFGSVNLPNPLWTCAA